VQTIVSTWQVAAYLFMVWHLNVIDHDILNLAITTFDHLSPATTFLQPLPFSGTLEIMEADFTIMASIGHSLKRGL